ncbi:unnamed protein product [Calicophoron daubneyi]|uniref:Uncharacterized protein n=1 Tax=Calicophoron daubneyi TaxID=300641 RepID=A0AAV2TV55_CALDB
MTKIQPLSKWRWREYTVNLRPAYVQRAFSNPTVRAALSKTGCWVDVQTSTPNADNERLTEKEVSIVRINGPNYKSIAELDTELECTLPAYRYRQNYCAHLPASVSHTKEVMDSFITELSHKRFDRSNDPEFSSDRKSAYITDHIERNKQAANHGLCLNNDINFHNTDRKESATSTDQATVSQTKKSSNRITVTQEMTYETNEISAYGHQALSYTEMDYQCYSIDRNDLSLHPILWADSEPNVMEGSTVSHAGRAEIYGIGCDPCGNLSHSDASFSIKAHFTHKPCVSAEDEQNKSYRALVYSLATEGSMSFAACSKSETSIEMNTRNPKPSQANAEEEKCESIINVSKRAKSPDLKGQFLYWEPTIENPVVQTAYFASRAARLKVAASISVQRAKRTPCNSLRRSISDSETLSAAREPFYIGKRTSLKFPGQEVKTSLARGKEIGSFGRPQPGKGHIRRLTSQTRITPVNTFIDGKMLTSQSSKAENTQTVDKQIDSVSSNRELSQPSTMGSESETVVIYTAVFKSTSCTTTAQTKISIRDQSNTTCSNRASLPNPPTSMKQSPGFNRSVKQETGKSNLADPCEIETSMVDTYQTYLQLESCLSLANSDPSLTKDEAPANGAKVTETLKTEGKNRSDSTKPPTSSQRSKLNTCEKHDTELSIGLIDNVFEPELFSAPEVMEEVRGKSGEDGRSSTQLDVSPAMLRSPGGVYPQRNDDVRFQSWINRGIQQSDGSVQPEVITAVEEMEPFFLKTDKGPQSTDYHKLVEPFSLTAHRSGKPEQKSGLLLWNSLTGCKLGSSREEPEEVHSGMNTAPHVVSSLFRKSSESNKSIPSQNLVERVNPPRHRTSKSGHNDDIRFQKPVVKLKVTPDPLQPADVIQHPVNTNLQEVQDLTTLIAGLNQCTDRPEHHLPPSLDHRSHGGNLNPLGLGAEQRQVSPPREILFQTLGKQCRDDVYLTDKTESGIPTIQDYFSIDTEEYKTSPLNQQPNFGSMHADQMHQDLWRNGETSPTCNRPYVQSPSLHAPEDIVIGTRHGTDMYIPLRIHLDLHFDPLSPNGRLVPFFVSQEDRSVTFPDVAGATVLHQRLMSPQNKSPALAPKTTSASAIRNTNRPGETDNYRLATTSSQHDDLNSFPDPIHETLVVSSPTPMSAGTKTNGHSIPGRVPVFVSDPHSSSVMVNKTPSKATSTLVLQSHDNIIGRPLDHSEEHSVNTDDVIIDRFLVGGSARAPPGPSRYTRMVTKEPTDQTSTLIAPTYQTDSYVHYKPYVGFDQVDPLAKLPHPRPPLIRKNAFRQGEDSSSSLTQINNLLGSALPQQVIRPIPLLEIASDGAESANQTSLHSIPSILTHTFSPDNVTPNPLEPPNSEFTAVAPEASRPPVLETVPGNSEQYLRVDVTQEHAAEQDMNKRRLSARLLMSPSPSQASERKVSIPTSSNRVTARTIKTSQESVSQLMPQFTHNSDTNSEVKPDDEKLPSIPNRPDEHKIRCNTFPSNRPSSSNKWISVVNPTAIANVTSCYAQEFDAFGVPISYCSAIATLYMVSPRENQTACGNLVSLSLVYGHCQINGSPGPTQRRFVRVNSPFGYTSLPSHYTLRVCGDIYQAGDRSRSVVLEVTDCRSVSVPPHETFPPNSNPAGEGTEQMTSETIYTHYGTGWPVWNCTSSEATPCPRSFYENFCSPTMRCHSPHSYVRCFRRCYNSPPTFSLASTVEPSNPMPTTTPDAQLPKQPPVESTETYDGVEYDKNGRVLNAPECVACNGPCKGVFRNTFSHLRSPFVNETPGTPVWHRRITDNVRVRAALSRLNCHLRAFYRRSLLVLQLAAPDTRVLNQCNKLLECIIPSYANRKEYNSRGPHLSAEFLGEDANVSPPRYAVSEHSSWNYYADGLTDSGSHVICPRSRRDFILPPYATQFCSNLNNPYGAEVICARAADRRIRPHSAVSMARRRKGGWDSAVRASSPSCVKKTHIDRRLQKEGIVKCLGWKAVDLNEKIRPPVLVEFSMNSSATPFDGYESGKRSNVVRCEPEKLVEDKTGHNIELSVESVAPQLPGQGEDVLGSKQSSQITKHSEVGDGNNEVFPQSECRKDVRDIKSPTKDVSVCTDECLSAINFLAPTKSMTKTDTTEATTNWMKMAANDKQDDLKSPSSPVRKTDFPSRRSSVEPDRTSKQCSPVIVGVNDTSSFECRKDDTENANTLSQVQTILSHDTSSTRRPRTQLTVSSSTNFDSGQIANHTAPEQNISPPPVDHRNPSNRPPKRLIRMGEMKRGKLSEFTTGGVLTEGHASHDVTTRFLATRLESPNAGHMTVKSDQEKRTQFEAKQCRSSIKSMVNGIDEIPLDNLNICPPEARSSISDVGNPRTSGLQVISSEAERFRIRSCGVQTPFAEAGKSENRQEVLIRLDSDRDSEPPEGRIYRTAVTNPEEEKMAWLSKIGATPDFRRDILSRMLADMFTTSGHINQESKLKRGHFQDPISGGKPPTNGPDRPVERSTMTSPSPYQTIHKSANERDHTSMDKAKQSAGSHTHSGRANLLDGTGSTDLKRGRGYPSSELLKKVVAASGETDDYGCSDNMTEEFENQATEFNELRIQERRKSKDHAKLDPPKSHIPSTWSNDSKRLRICTVQRRVELFRPEFVGQTLHRASQVTSSHTNLFRSTSPPEQVVGYVASVSKPPSPLSRLFGGPLGGNVDSHGTVKSKIIIPPNKAIRTKVPQKRTVLKNSSVQYENTVSPQIESAKAPLTKVNQLNQPSTVDSPERCGSLDTDRDGDRVPVAKRLKLPPDAQTNQKRGEMLQRKATYTSRVTSPTESSSRKIKQKKSSENQRNDPKVHLSNKHPLIAKRDAPPSAPGVVGENRKHERMATQNAPQKKENQFHSLKGLKEKHSVLENKRLGVEKRPKSACKAPWNKSPNPNSKRRSVELSKGSRASTVTPSKRPSKQREKHSDAKPFRDIRKIVDSYLSSSSRASGMSTAYIQQDEGHDLIRKGEPAVIHNRLQMVGLKAPKICISTESSGVTQAGEIWQKSDLNQVQESELNDDYQLPIAQIGKRGSISLPTRRCSSADDNFTHKIDWDLAIAAPAISRIEEDPVKEKSISTTCVSSFRFPSSEIRAVDERLNEAVQGTLTRILFDTADKMCDTDEVKSDEQINLPGVSFVHEDSPDRAREQMNLPALELLHSDKLKWEELQGGDLKPSDLIRMIAARLNDIQLTQSSSRGKMGIRGRKSTHCEGIRYLWCCTPWHRSCSQ